MKKMFAIISFVLILSGVPLGSASAAAFPDLQEGNRFYEEIQYLIDEEIISGFPDETFRPKDSLTRAQAAILLGRALGYDGTQRDTAFPDVGASQKASGYIAEAAENGVISGYPDGSYKPDATITRAEMAIILHRAFSFDGLEGNIHVHFTDMSEKVRSYEAVMELAKVGVVAGYEEAKFRPDVQLNREQFSAFLARTLNHERFAITPGTSKWLSVTFLDVGQGDAIFIEYPNRHRVLIDAGRYPSAIEAALRQHNIHQIDTFIATHPDADHIGGAAHVIENYGVTRVIDSGQEHTTQTFIDYLEAVDASGAAFEIAEIGDDLSEDPRVTADVLHVDPEADDLNDGSIVLKMSHGQNDFLFTGDAGVEVEEELLASGENLGAEILKVSHHGSRTGTSQAFVDAVQPEIAVLSVGNNAYGHPHAEVVERLQAAGADVISTEDGSFRVLADKTEYLTERFKKIGDDGSEPSKPGDPGEEPAFTAVKITEKDLAAEIVTVTNTGNAAVDLTGWTLVSANGNQRYTFPDGFTLAAGTSVDVMSGPDAVHNPPSVLKWTNANIWNNSGDEAFIEDEAGRLVHRLP